MRIEVKANNRFKPTPNRSEVCCPRRCALRYGSTWASASQILYDRRRRNMRKL